MAEQKQSKNMILAIVLVAVVIIAAAGIWAYTSGSDDDKDAKDGENTNTEPVEKELTVYAAASLTASFTELGEAYEAAHPGVTVTFQFAGSNTLVKQMTEGATPDIFASADTANMDTVKNAGLMDESTIKTFVQNKPVLIVPKSNLAGIESLADLANDNVMLVLGQNGGVPIGTYTHQILAAANKSTDEGGLGAGFKEAVLANVVSEELNVNDIKTKVANGDADVGIVYKTDAMTVSSDVIIIDLPDEYNVIATYPIGVLNESHDPDEAKSFVDFMLSAEGQAIMAKYGFASP